MLSFSLLGVTESNVARLELIDHVLCVIGCSIVVSFEVLSILGSVCFWWTIVKSHLNSLISLFVVFCVCCLSKIASTDISMRNIRVSLDRRCPGFIDVTQLLFLTEHSLLVLSNLGLVARDFGPIHLTCASIH